MKEIKYYNPYQGSNRRLSPLWRDVSFSPPAQTPPATPSSMWSPRLPTPPPSLSLPSKPLAASCHRCAALAAFFRRCGAWWPRRWKVQMDAPSPRPRWSGPVRWRSSCGRFTTWLTSALRPFATQCRQIFSLLVKVLTCRKRLILSFIIQIFFKSNSQTIFCITVKCVAVDGNRGSSEDLDLLRVQHDEPHRADEGQAPWSDHHVLPLHRLQGEVTWVTDDWHMNLWVFYSILVLIY